MQGRLPDSIGENSEGGRSMVFRMKAQGTVLICMEQTESEAVKIAAGNLETDLGRVLDGLRVLWCGNRGDRTRPQTDGEMPVTDGTEGQRADCVRDPAVIWIGTIGASETVRKLADTEALTDEAGNLRKEAYQIRVKDGQLVIAGTDRRGTVYGIYEFCERLGVSPWYFWADVPVRTKEEICLQEGYQMTDWPSVEYRGIFINDEEELEAWVQKYMGEPTIGIRTYEKVFELLLRLKANYIWPAMHVNSFNLSPENGALAERMGIVAGTSHCDMLMRSNNREWIPWIEKKGYTDAVYDYSIEGRNREILQEYWRESVEQNQDFEVCYTLGMRGIHDSGFETKELAGKPPEEKRRAKVELLERIIHDQRKILEETLGGLPMMTFIPYKEVLELYDNGLQVPEDMTLVWANDNYGYIRRFPSKQEQKRAGGNGIYYHNSYWAPPGMSYVFLCSIPLAHTRNELQKAWDEGIRKLWVLNTGAIKPLEQEVTFFLRLAWEIGKEDGLTRDVEAFTADWADRMFTGGIGREVAGLLHDFAQLTNVRKLENMDYDAFSQTAYGDEAAGRIHKYEELFRRGNALYENLPKQERDAFYQLVLMRIHAGYFTNLAYYYGDRSTLMYERGNMQAAALYTAKSREFEDVRRRMIRYYNAVMAEGKWDGILNPEGYPPPRAAMMPVCTPPLAISGTPRMRVDVWNEAGELVFGQVQEKWIEIGNTGGGKLEVQVQVPEWLEIAGADLAGSGEPAAFAPHCLKAEAGTELRVCLRPCGPGMERQGEILVESVGEGRTVCIPVRIVPVSEQAVRSPSLALPVCGFDGRDRADGCGKTQDVGGSADICPAVPSEEDGLIAIEADSALGLGENEAFRVIRRLGRSRGNLVEACSRERADLAGAGKPLAYFFDISRAGSCLLELHRFPSLNSTGRIRIGVSLDGGPVQVMESFSNDEWKGNWKKNVLNNVDRLYMELELAKGGRHRLELHAMDAYFAFSRLVIYTEPRKENNLAGLLSGNCQRLPEEWDTESWCGDFYGDIRLKPRALEYVATEMRDTIVKVGRNVQAEVYGDCIEPVWYLEQGNRIFEEHEGAVRIDAAAALAGSRFAWVTSDLWRHCAGESFGRSGLCLYVRRPELKWEDSAEAPALHYRFCCEGGSYRLWMLTKFNYIEESAYRIGLDGNMIPREELYNRGSMFRYESEQIYQWVPVVRLAVGAGEHVLDVYSMASGMRYDRFYLTRGEELPPMDGGWLYCGRGNFLDVHGG